MPIHILPDHIASQIAAGEVIERPASVVKELIENSIDAGAGHISVVIEGAGQRLIEVADDGAGIPEEELPLALARHATSKLEKAEDLFNIQTLGFRGEALASIGSVSRLTLTSYTGQSEVGARIRIEGGRADKLNPIGVPKGSVVRVEDLFFNVPARLKFLKSDSTERRHITALVTRYAMAYAHVRWEFKQDGKIILQTSGNGDRREILASLYGVQEARGMLGLDFLERDIQISGFISPISMSRSNRREITIFVNGRWVQDASVTAAIIKAYHTML
ncbi:MAG: DNA mismatch repair endonuclease MutL, partial [Chloroflexota bacterium]